MKSLDADQLKGKNVSVSTLRNGDCKPLAVSDDGKAVYPCGLIANSLFNGEHFGITFLLELLLTFRDFKIPSAV